MADSGSAPSLSEYPEPELEYRSVEPWSLIGLSLGLLSAVALLGPVLWLVPAVGVVANLIALRRLKLDTNRIGRSVALLGLALSVIFGVAPAAHKAASFVILSRQARPVADRWFEFLRENSPEKALILRYAPDQRPPIDDFVSTYFRHDKEARDDLERFVKIPAVRTLLELGPRANIRFYKTASVATEGDRGLVNFYYTVTYGDGADKKTFFLSIVLERNATKMSGASPWRVVDVSGGLDPRASTAL